MQLYRNILHGEVVANDETRRYFQDYFDLLLDDMTFSMQDAISEAKRMNEIFLKDEVALNILAKLYLEQILGNIISEYIHMYCMLDNFYPRLWFYQAERYT